MEIHFGDKKIRDICEKAAVANQKLGPSNARKLRVRLSELEAAPNASALVFGRPHPLEGGRKGQFAIDLSGGYRLVFAPRHDPNPTRADGSIDWTAVTIICIEFIGDYHDD